MNARAGVVTSQVAWLASLPVTVAAPTLTLSIKGAVAGFVVAALASFLPDLDHHKSTVGRYFPRWFRRLLGGHRMGSHSLIAIGGSWWLAGYLLENPILANAILVGWASHVVLDLLTVDGVGLLYPLTRTTFRIGWIVTGSRTEDRFVVCMKVLGVLVGAFYAYLLAGGPTS